MPVWIALSKCKNTVKFCWIKPNRNGQIHILGTHETLPKYTSQARDANLRHYDWLKSASRVAQNSWWTAGEQLAHMRCSNFDKPVYTIRLKYTPHVITFCPDQIVLTVLGIYELYVV